MSYFSGLVFALAIIITFKTYPISSDLYNQPIEDL